MQAADALDAIKEGFLADEEDNIAISTDLKEIIGKAFDTKGTSQLADAIKALKEDKSVKGLATDSLKTIAKAKLDMLAQQIKSGLTSYELIRQTTDKRVEKYRDQVRRSYWRERHLFYGLLGGSGSSFSYLNNPTATTNLNDRFETKKFESVRYGIGYNYQRAGKMVVGISLVGQKVNNFSSLDAADYTTTNTTQVSSATAITQPVASTSTVQKLDDKQTFTGYSGDYQTYHQTAINVDVVSFHRGSETGEGVVTLNYYGRYLISSKPTVVPTTITLGAGAYFFQNNGTFLGGIYLEFPDITNQTEALKPTPAFKPFYNRLSFGIITKFSISSIISYGL